MSTPETRIVHLHIPKTAGTSLRVALQAAMPGGVLCPQQSERRLDGIEPDRFDLFSGHFGYQAARRIGGRIITVFRDPVDRFVSVYYFWRELHESGHERSRKTALARNFSLHEFAALKDDTPLAEEFFNRMTWQLAHTNLMPGRQVLRDEGCGEAALLGRAIANLQAIEVVGLQDRPDLLAEAVSRRLGLTLGIPRVNVTEKRPEIGDLPAATRRRILEWVYLDTEIYQAACALVAAADRGG